MRNLNSVILIATLVSLIACSKKDENSNQATMNVQESKSVAKEVPYKSEIERGLATQFYYVNIPQGTIYLESSMLYSGMTINGKMIDSDPDAYMKFLLASEKDGLITIKKASDNTANGKYYNKQMEVAWTPKALSLRDKKNSNDNWLRIQFGACNVKTIVKDIEYHNPSFSQTDDFRLVMGTYEVKPNDFGKSHGLKGGVFKFREVIKLNPFNQTYLFVSADWGEIDADGWQTLNVEQ